MITWSIVVEGKVSFEYIWSDQLMPLAKLEEQAKQEFVDRIRGIDEYSNVVEIEVTSEEMNWMCPQCGREYEMWDLPNECECGAKPEVRS